MWLSRTEAKMGSGQAGRFPTKGWVVPVPEGHSQVSLHHIYSDLQLNTVQTLQDVLDVLCGKAGQGRELA